MNDVISTLNDLIQTSKDGEKGFRTAAEQSKGSELRSLLSTYADECAAGATELQALVRNLGGDPSDRGSVGGALHRGIVDAKAAITGHSDHSILEECERGEDVAKRAYSDALKKDLPAEVRAVVQRQYDGVLKHHDRMRALRDMTAKAST